VGECGQCHVVSIRRWLGTRACDVVIVQSGADVKLRDHEGFSAAYYAQMSGCVDCVELLHSLGSPLHSVATTTTPAH